MHRSDPGEHIRHQMNISAITCWNPQVLPAIELTGILLPEFLFPKSNSGKMGSDKPVYLFAIGSRFSCENRIVIFLFQSKPDFIISTGITIAIEKRIRLNRDPFSFCGYFDTRLRELLSSFCISNQVLVYPVKSDRGFGLAGPVVGIRCDP